jgi:hypothetical protein
MEGFVCFRKIDVRSADLTLATRCGRDLEVMCPILGVRAQATEFCVHDPAWPCPAHLQHSFRTLQRQCTGLGTRSQQTSELLANKCYPDLSLLRPDPREASHVVEIE